MAVAAEWRSRWAPFEGAFMIPARCRAASTIPETVDDWLSGRMGALVQRNMRSVLAAGRTVTRYSIKASPASWAKGKRTSLRPLPRTRTVPASQSRSSRRMATISPARRPSRTSHNPGLEVWRSLPRSTRQRTLQDVVERSHLARRQKTRPSNRRFSWVTPYRRRHGDARRQHTFMQSHLSSGRRFEGLREAINSRGQPALRINTVTA